MPELVTLNEDRCFTRKHWFSRTSFLVSVASRAKRKEKNPFHVAVFICLYCLFKLYLFESVQVIADRNYDPGEQV